jgi:hypothetical protein
MEAPEETMTPIPRAYQIQRPNYFCFGNLILKESDNERTNLVPVNHSGHGDATFGPSLIHSTGI